MSLRALGEQFDRWRDEGRDMVLATVIATAGSTYSKAGAQMLIAGGDYRGLLSGGCLEGDLTAHAEQCLANGTARIVSYDMRQRDEDEIWGLGLGCDGALDILLQPLRARADWEPFSSIAAAGRSGARAAFALVTASATPAGTAGPAAGDALLVSGDEHSVLGDLPAALVEALVAHCREAIDSASPVRAQVGGGATPVVDVLCAPVAAPLRLLLLGAGPDTLPVLRMARELGWYVTQADHRPGNLAAAAAAAPVDASLEVTPGRLADVLDPNAFDAVVVMSHHLASDRAYLAELALTDVPFIGLLGPAARRRRLLGDVAKALGAQAGGTALRDVRALTARTHGPVGLDLGARDPAGIALSILAEVQQFHARNR